MGAPAVQLLATLDAEVLMYQREVGWKTNLLAAFEYKKPEFRAEKLRAAHARDREGSGRGSSRIAQFWCSQREAA